MSTGTAQSVTYGLDASYPRLSVARYQRMIENGSITAEDKVELLENWVVLKMPRNAPHNGTVLRINRRLGQWLPTGWDFQCQGTVVLTDSQPEPDFTVLRADPDDYTTRNPTAADTGLVIEVADSSLLRDQRDKTRIYARAGIPVYWIINLVDRRVEVYTQPSGPTAVPAYGAFQTYQPGDSVPLVLDGAVVGSVPAADLLP